jgi:hypothetical protein
MKKLLSTLAVAVVAVAALTTAASAGGWATVGLSSLPPSGLEPNQAWPVDITVLQHGQTPVAGLAPIVRVRDDGGNVVGTFRGSLTDTQGISHAVVRFPGEGTYSYEVFDAFTLYGGAQTHTFKPVEIGPAGDAFPWWQLGLALALALGLAAATVLYLRRDHGEPAPVTNMKEAA